MAERATFVDLWPLIIIEAPVHSTYESIEYFCEKQTELFKKRERFGTVQDMTRMKGLLDAKSRKRLADWTKENDEAIKRYLIASSSVTDNAMIRGLITAVHWFAKPATPQEITGSMRAGVDFVVDHLRRANVPMSPKLETYQRSLSGQSSRSA